MQYKNMTDLATKYINITNIIRNRYDILSKQGYNVLGVFLYGSQNYDLDYDGSDIDTKAIILPSMNDLIVGNNPVSKTVDIDEYGQCDIKDIRKIFECFEKQNASYIETLFTPYYILNNLYAEEYKSILNMREAIAGYNKHKALECIVGMILQKQFALCHPYPTIKNKIDKYGYDSKQVHHIERLYEFMIRYFNDNQLYSECLISSNLEHLINVKANSPYTKEEAISIAGELADLAKTFKQDYIKSTVNNVNPDVLKLMNGTMNYIIKQSIIEEVKQCLS